MSRFNNFSPLPWYPAIDEQHARQWWVYGHIYPLYSADDSLVPCQIIRDAVDGTNPATRLTMGHSLANSTIDASGNVVSEPGTLCWDFGDMSSYDGSVLRLFNGPDTEGKPAWTLLDDGVPIDYGTGLINVDVGSGTTTLVVRWDFGVYTQLWRMSNNIEPQLPLSMELYTADGAFVKSMWQNGLWTIKRDGTKDYLVATPGVTLLADMDEGQYYFKMSDGTNTFFSDVFTVVKDLMPFVKLEWYDDTDFLMDAGRIVYTSPAYHNVLYLRTEIAKPEYEFEEEGETRDGLFYPTKQLSWKKYNFHFLAPEYLLDVLRFVRMSEHVILTYSPDGVRTEELRPTSFLLTPDWESEGDLAGVKVEMETDTVAKKLGIGYIR